MTSRRDAGALGVGAEEEGAASVQASPRARPKRTAKTLGRWKNAKTVLACYQRPDEGQLRKALEARRGAEG